MSEQRTMAELGYSSNVYPESKTPWINRALSLLARRTQKSIQNAQRGSWLLSHTWDAIGLGFLTWAAFSLHSALGMTMAAISSFVMARKFRPTS